MVFIRSWPKKSTQETIMFSYLIFPNEMIYSQNQTGKNWTAVDTGRVNWKVQMFSLFCLKYCEQFHIQVIVKCKFKKI